MRGSLFNRVLVTLLASLLVLWLGATALSVWRVHREAGVLHDRQLAQTAQVLLALAGQEIVEHLEQGDTPYTASRTNGDALGLSDLAAHLAEYSSPGGLEFHIHATDDSFQFHSGGFPRGLDDDGVADGFTDRAFSDGQSWRIYTRHDDARIVAVQVTQQLAERNRMRDAIMSAILPPLVAGLPLTIALTLLHVRRARRPLTALAEALAVRGPQQLTPIRVEHPPSEIAPIVTALNRLVERLRERMESERRFTADAAHELRTPLAALQSDAELALESTGERRDAALSRLRAGTRRAARLVGQMLTLARIDPIAGIEDVERLELGALAQEVLSALAPVAARGELELSLDERTGAYIRGHAALIEVLLRNLVDNAIRYTPPGGQIEVSIGTDAQGVFLRVADSGPGIPREVRERVLQPFYRHASANVPGTGLGLSIVVRVAKLHHATLTLGDAQAGGLEATVRFPADG